MLIAPGAVSAALSRAASAADAEGPTAGFATLEPIGYADYPLPSRDAEAPTYT